MKSGCSASTHRSRFARLSLGVAPSDLVPPDVAARLHLDRALARARGAGRRRTFSMLGACSTRLVGRLLERDARCRAGSAVLRDEHLGLAVVDAIAERVGREAAEDDACASRRCARTRASPPRPRGPCPCRSRRGRPSSTPSLRERVGAAHDLAVELAYVSVRAVGPSSSSPSQMIAALLRRRSSRCRSRQLSVTLSVAPTNHFACGSSHSSSVVHGVRQTRSAVSRFQNVSGDSRLSR